MISYRAPSSPIRLYITGIAPGLIVPFLSHQALPDHYPPFTQGTSTLS